MRKFLFVLFVGAAALLGGCASYNAQVYSSGGGLSAMPTRTGTVVAVRLVKIRPKRGSVGSMFGALIGAAGANSLAGNGHVLADAVGAIAGGLAGQKIQAGLSGLAQQVTVEMKDRRLITVVQKGIRLNVGDKVAIDFSPAGKARVFRV